MRCDPVRLIHHALVRCTPRAAKGIRRFKKLRGAPRRGSTNFVTSRQPLCKSVSLDRAFRVAERSLQRSTEPSVRSIPTRISTSDDEARSAQPRPDGDPTYPPASTNATGRRRPWHHAKTSCSRRARTSRVMPGMPPVGHFSYGSIPALYRHRSNRRPCRSTSLQQPDRRWPVARAVSDDLEPGVIGTLVPVIAVHRHVDLPDSRIVPDHGPGSAAAMSVEVQHQDRPGALPSEPREPRSPTR